MIQTLSALIADDGTGTASFTVNQDRGFILERMMATGPATSNVLPGLLRVYLNGDLIDHTQSAAADTSELQSPLALHLSDQIRADWSSCAPGSTMTLTLRGTQ